MQPQTCWVWFLQKHMWLICIFSLMMQVYDDRWCGTLISTCIKHDYLPFLNCSGCGPSTQSFHNQVLSMLPLVWPCIYNTFTWNLYTCHSPLWSGILRCYYPASEHTLRAHMKSICLWSWTSYTHVITLLGLKVATKWQVTNSHLCSITPC